MIGISAIDLSFRIDSASPNPSISGILTFESKRPKGSPSRSARAALRGAKLNVEINTAGFDDAEFVEEKLRAAAEMAEEAEKREAEVLAVVEERMGGG